MATGTHTRHYCSTPMTFGGSSQPRRRRLVKRYRLRRPRFCTRLSGPSQCYTNRAAHGIAHCEHALALYRNSAHTHAMLEFAKYLTWSWLTQLKLTSGHVLPFSSRHFHLYLVCVVRRQPSCSSMLDTVVVVWLRRSLDQTDTTRLLISSSLLPSRFSANSNQARAASASRAYARSHLHHPPPAYATRACGTHPRFVSVCQRAIEGMRIAGCLKRQWFLNRAGVFA